MPNKTLLIFLGLEALFVGTGVVLLAVGLIFQPRPSGQTGPLDPGTNLLLSTAPLTSAIANAVLVFFSALVALPGILMSKDRKILRAHSFLVVICGVLSLVVGLIIWFGTLTTRTALGTTYAQQTNATQSAIQQEFQCCGYSDFNTPPFVPDNTCTNSLIAARLGPCQNAFSGYANQFMDVVFTAVFGFVAIDSLVFLSTISMIKKREEIERYHIIDRKHGQGGI